MHGIGAVFGHQQRWMQRTPAHFSRIVEGRESASLFSFGRRSDLATRLRETEQNMWDYIAIRKVWPMCHLLATSLGIVYQSSGPIFRMHCNGLVYAGIRAVLPAALYTHITQTHSGSDIKALVEGQTRVRWRR